MQKFCQKGFILTATPQDLIQRLLDVAGKFLTSNVDSMNNYLLHRGLFVLWGGWGERKRERAGHDGKGEERRETSAI